MKKYIIFIVLILQFSCDSKKIQDTLSGATRLSENYFLLTTDSANYFVGYDGGVKSEYKGVGSWVVAYLVTKNYIYILQMQSEIEPTSELFSIHEPSIVCNFHRITIANDNQIVQSKAQWLDSIKTEVENSDISSILKKTTTMKKLQHCYNSITN